MVLCLVTKHSLVPSRRTEDLNMVGFWLIKRSLLSNFSVKFLITCTDQFFSKKYTGHLENFEPALTILFL